MLTRSPLTTAARLTAITRRLIRALVLSGAVQALLTATAVACSNGNGFPN